MECKTNEPNLMRTDMRYYTLPIILLIISTMFSRAIALDPTKATVLPSMDWVRIPVKATMDSDAWRPLDPVDDDQGGA